PRRARPRRPPPRPSPSPRLLPPPASRRPRRPGPSLPGFVSRQRAESALRFLPQKSSQFETFHAGSFLVVIRDFMDWIERDEALLHVVAARRRRLPGRGKDWADEAVKKGAPPPLPEEPVACFAFRYDAIRSIRLEKVDLRYFITSFYPGSHLNEKLMHWK